MDWSGVDYCDVLSDSHSDGTHSLQSIHCWDTDAVMHLTNLMKKQTHPDLGWPEDEHIYSTFSYLWPWTTKLVLNRWGIFVEIAKNTLYGSKFGHNHTSMESCINLNFKKLTLRTGFVVQGHICVNYFFNAITTKKRLSFFCGAQK